MDNFIDKFAQRRNAQEIIRANAMAEAKERERLQSELSEYELAMQEMRRCNLQNLENAEKVKELLETSLDKINAVQKKTVWDDGGTDKTVGEVRLLLESLKRQVEELLHDGQNRTQERLKSQQSRMEELFQSQQMQMKELAESQQSRTTDLFAEQRALLAEQNTQTKELMDSQKEAFEERIKAAEEFNHKEAVKVYRNVQAVVEGALPKQTAEIEETFKKAAEKGKASGAILVIGVITLLAALGNLAVEVLRILGYL